MVNASKSAEEIKERLGKIFYRLEAIENDLGKGRKDLRESFREQVNSVVHQLCQHFLSDDIKERFTCWSEEDAPDVDAWSWKEVEEYVSAALSRRFQEIVDQWEKKNKVLSTARISLMEQFQNYLNNFEFKLQNVQTEAAVDDANSPNKLAFRSQFSFWQQALWNASNVILYTLSWLDYLTGRTPCMKIELLSDVKERYSTILLRHVSSDILHGSLERALKPFVEDKLKDAKLFLDRIEARLQERIEADRQLYKQLYQRPGRYGSVFYEAKQQREQLAKFGLSEVCAVKIDSKELEWKEEASSCLGRGAFGAVYQGTMKRDGEVTIVALKVWNEAPDAANAKEIMEEIKNLR